MMHTLSGPQLVISTCLLVPAGDGERSLREAGLAFAVMLHH